jgi:hypothetical protein
LLKLGKERENRIMPSVENSETGPHAPGEIVLPAPTAWPIVLAFGVTLLFAGLLTAAAVTVLGALLALAGAVGWFREVFPHEHEEVVHSVPDQAVEYTSRRVVERFPLAEEQARAWLPVETYPISAGIKGGLAGSVAMAILACAFGLLKFGSIWYPINLLSGGISDLALSWTPAEMNSFHLVTFALAAVLHLSVSLLVGLLYGAMLPMFARRPILLGGLLAPVLWSGLLYSILNILDPLLQQRIDWYWFVASQVAFGVVAGLIVLRQHRVRTEENMPFALRAGIEAPGIISPKNDGENRP